MIKRTVESNRRSRHDPTARQIQRRAAAIRATWSHRERALRSVGIIRGERAKLTPEAIEDLLAWTPPLVPSRAIEMG